MTDQEILAEIERIASEAKALVEEQLDLNNLEENLEKQDAILEEAMALGNELPEGLCIGKYLEFQVADGEAVYLVDQIEEMRVHCRLIPHLDAYEASAVDEYGWCLRSIAEEQIDRREWREKRERKTGGDRS